MITTKLVRKLLNYDAQTGEFRWRATGKGRRANCVAGNRRSRDGRNVICIQGKLYLASRLAWVYMTGTWPTCQVDHSDLDPTNDAWDNLRLASNGQNKCNQRKQANNTTGYKGVSLFKGGPKYRAYIKVDGRQMQVGVFASAKEAWHARRKAALHHYGAFARE